MDVIFLLGARILGEEVQAGPSAYEQPLPQPLTLPPTTRPPSSPHHFREVIADVLQPLGSQFHEKWAWRLIRVAASSVQVVSVMKHRLFVYVLIVHVLTNQVNSNEIWTNSYINYFNCLLKNFCNIYCKRLG